MSTWTTQTIVDGTPNEVLAVLSDPDCCCSRWSPIDVDLEDLGRTLSLALRPIAAEVERTMDRVPA